MKIKNQKGFTGIEIAGVIAIGFLAVTFIAPLVGIHIPGAAGKTSTQKQIKTTKQVPYVNPATGQPIKILNADGSTTVLMNQESSDQTLDETIIPKAPLAERVALWFVHLGVLGLALALAFPAAAVWLWAWIRGRWNKLKQEIAEHKDEREALEGEAQLIVRGLDLALATIPATLAGETLPGEVDRAALAKRISDKILLTLSTNYDRSTKDLVRALR